MTKSFVVSTFVSLLLVACAAENGDELNRGKNGDPNGNPGQDPGQNPGTTPGTDPTQPGGCKEGTPHIGFGGTDFVSERKPGGIGLDRRRLKPYSAMSSEFQRALGVVPTNLVQSQAAFGQVPARWFQEPTAGAVSLYTTYNLAFTTCYDTMTGANYQAAPTAATAADECAKMQRKFWQRTATPEEVKACSDFVMDTATETVARRRWAHACASVLTSTGFTTY